MSWWSLALNVFRGDDLNRDIDAELKSHLDEAIERGRDPGEARTAFGSALRHREASRDVRVLTWLDALRADLVFGLRQLQKHSVTSVAAILSLGLALGACVSAFRLIDAMLLRPLPVAGADRLRVVAQQGVDPGGHFRISDSAEYPLFTQIRAAVREQADVIAISYSDRPDLTFGSDEEMERAYRQYVSGWMFDAFGLHSVIGRLLTPADDAVPRAHPYSVLSYEYWSSRFGRDPTVVGRSFRMDNTVYQIVGVAPRGFTGTEPGVSIDLFVPTMMNPFVTRSDASWVRVFLQLHPGVPEAPVRDRLQAVFRRFQEGRNMERAFLPKAAQGAFLNQTVLLEPATAGVSVIQGDYGRALAVVGVLVALVLLIACTNLANLLAGQATARAREMALRVSLGAGRRRLVQLVLVESVILASLAAAVGALFAWWSAPFVVGHINPPSDPVRLLLPIDGRVVAFGLGLTLGVTCLLGALPAARASMVKPAVALRGGPNRPSRRRLMRTLIAAQVAFCVVIVLVAVLFSTTLQRLVEQPLGFSAARILTLNTVAHTPQPPALWDQVDQHLRDVPGVEAVAYAGFALLSGESWNGFVWIDGAPSTNVLAVFLGVSPGWLEVMKIPLIEGRDFVPADGKEVAIVNEAFAKTYLGGRNPIGQWFEKTQGPGHRVRFQIVGLVPNALYQHVREPITPAAYVPFSSMSTSGAQRAGAFVVRTAGADPSALAARLRQEVPRGRSEFRVSSIRTQDEIDRAQTVRERLLATLAEFFSAVALLLTGIGLYGVLHYAVVQRHREIGIRRAIGAPTGDIAWLVTGEVALALAIGIVVGLASGIVSVRFVTTLLYGARATDPSVLAAAGVAMLAAAVIAIVPPLTRALQVNPIEILRAE